MGRKISTILSSKVSISDLWMSIIQLENLISGTCMATCLITLFSVNFKINAKSLTSLCLGLDKHIFFSAKFLMFFYPKFFNYVLGAQKNCLIETVLLSTHNICLH